MFTLVARAAWAIVIASLRKRRRGWGGWAQARHSQAAGGWVVFAVLERHPNLFNPFIE